LFLASASIPVVTFVVVSSWRPDRTIDVYPTAAAPGTAIQSYYVSHYPGATVQIAETRPPGPGTAQRPVPRKISILLPRARIDLAWVALWACAAAGAFYQALMLATLPFRWCQWLLPICCGALAPTGVLAFSAYTIAQSVRLRASADQPPVLDRALTFIAQHSLAAFLFAAVLIACALPFSRGRFVRQEVLI
jgi:hypothetical protein